VGPSGDTVIVFACKSFTVVKGAAVGRASALSPDYSWLSSPRTAPCRTPEAPRQPGLRPDPPNGQSSCGKVATPA
ncbi:hypothetical protein M9458_034982, partial [Cirrhinus mrigala]